MPSGTRQPRALEQLEAAGKSRQSRAMESALVPSVVGRAAGPPNSLGLPPVEFVWLMVLIVLGGGFLNLAPAAHSCIRFALHMQL
mmetsp:Transcript_117477/g.292902  ORF Transcript_117477/g.292902 Transcript_117477/m.292902 type:complete len:85 (-) Transcript_117477:109-363(-)